MNFLAHLYLSNNDRKLMLGNFIGDFVKGNKYNEYPEPIAKGIKIHREIDRYTDSHAIVLESKKRLRPKYRHYSPVIVDMFYDHFLSLFWNHYHEQPLMDFTTEFYAYADQNKSLIPQTALSMLWYMSRDNWLYHYQFLEGLNKALSGMSRRTRYESKMDEAVQDLEIYYEEFKEEFLSFFPLLEAHIFNFIEEN